MARSLRRRTSTGSRWRSPGSGSSSIEGDAMARIRVGVLASGRGTDFQSLVDARKRGDLDVDLAVLVCNVPGSPVIERARSAGIPAVVIDHRKFGKDREAF